MRVASQVLPLVQEIPEEQVRNRLVTEWVKKEACWKRIEESDITLAPSFRATLVRIPFAPRRTSGGWKDRAHTLWRDGAWKRLRDWNKAQDFLTPDEADLVERAAIASQFAFKGFRLTKLQEAWERAVDNGFV